MDKKPTSPQNLKMIARMADQIMPILANMATRWIDESGHEDINAYKEVLIEKLRVICPSVKFIKMTTRPFGFVFEINTDASYCVFRGSKTAGWKRVIA